MDLEEIVISHTKSLERIDASTKSAHLRIDALLKISEAIQSLVIDFNKLASTVEQQGKDLTKIVGSLNKHDERMDNLEERMETKDTVQKLQDRVTDLEQKDGKNAEKLLGQIKWLLITFLVSGALGVIWTFITTK